MVAHALLSIVWAFDCESLPSPTRALRQSELVFVSVVEAIGERSPRVRVQEPFKGVQRDQILDVGLPAIGRTRARRVAIGHAYLFYLTRAENGWQALPCGRPHELGRAADDMRFLRGLPSSSAGTRLSGTVTMFTPLSGWTPLVGVRVDVVGQSIRRATTSAKDGAYEFLGLPPGTYRIEPERSPGLVAMPARANFGVTIGASEGVVVDFDFRWPTEVRMVVTDRLGQAFPWVDLRLVSIASHEAFDATATDGESTIRALPPGSYRVQATPRGEGNDGRPKPSFESPNLLEISSIERESRFAVRLPQELKFRRIRGQVLRPRGTPASGAHVTFSSGGFRSFAQASPDGRFEMKVPTGWSGTLAATHYLFTTVSSSAPIRILEEEVPTFLALRVTARK